MFDRILNTSLSRWTKTILNCIALKLATAWKMSKYGVIFGPYFPVFVPEKTPHLDTFHAVGFGLKFTLAISNMQYLAAVFWYWLCNIIVFTSAKQNPFPLFLKSHKVLRIFKCLFAKNIPLIFHSAGMWMRQTYLRHNFWIFLKNLKSLLCPNKTKLLPNSYPGVYESKCMRNSTYFDEHQKKIDKGHRTPTRWLSGKMGQFWSNRTQFNMQQTI